MMANVNLNKFGLTIALLLNKYKEAMNWGNGNTGSQAYKTLDRYFKNKGINWRYDFREFSTGLYKNYSHNEEAKKTIEYFVLGNVNNYLRENGFILDEGYLQIDNFKISLHSKK
jgi:predicted metal-dependent peptidase